MRILVDITSYTSGPDNGWIDRTMKATAAQNKSQCPAWCETGWRRMSGMENGLGQKVTPISLHLLATHHWSLCG